MKGEIIICQECGKETVSTSRGATQKYCPECRPIVQRRQRKSMETNYKHLCEQIGKMLNEYQDVIVPGLRNEIAQLNAEIKRLKEELMDEKYRRDRQADFAAGQGAKVDRLKAELEAARAERDTVTRRMIELEVANGSK